MENGFIHDAMQGAHIAKIGEFTLIQRFNERQVSAFKGGKCVETFDTREAAKAFALRDRESLTTIDYMKADKPLSGHASEWRFFRSYVGTALATTPNETNADGEYLDSNADISDISPETLESMLQDCAAFYFKNMGYIHCDGAPLANDIDGPIGAREAAMAGHDFWLTRCGHGAGFWDGDWPEPAATALDEASKEFGNVDLYVGDDGQIYA